MLFRPSSRAETDLGSGSTNKIFETILAERKQFGHTTLLVQLNTK